MLKKKKSQPRRALNQSASDDINKMLPIKFHKPFEKGYVDASYANEMNYLFRI
jgi:hypothetical protein